MLKVVVICNGWNQISMLVQLFFLDRNWVMFWSVTQRCLHSVIPKCQYVLYLNIALTICVRQCPNSSSTMYSGLGEVLGLALSLLSLGQQTAARSLHHSRSYHWYRPSEHTHRHMFTWPESPHHTTHTVRRWSRGSGTSPLQKKEIDNRFFCEVCSFKVRSPNSLNCNMLL